MRSLGQRQRSVMAAGLGVVVIGFAWATFPAVGPPPPAVTLQLPDEMLFCVTPATLCVGQPLPAGFPCSCADPFRGVLRGEVMTRREAERELLRRPARRLDPDAGETMLGIP